MEVKKGSPPDTSSEAKSAVNDEEIRPKPTIEEQEPRVFFALQKSGYECLGPQPKLALSRVVGLGLRGPPRALVKDEEVISKYLDMRDARLKAALMDAGLKVTDEERELGIKAVLAIAARSFPRLECFPPTMKGNFSVASLPLLRESVSSIRMAPSSDDDVLDFILYRYFPLPGAGQVPDRDLLAEGLRVIVAEREKHLWDAEDRLILHDTASAFRASTIAATKALIGAMDEADGSFKSFSYTSTDDIFGLVRHSLLDVEMDSRVEYMWRSKIHKSLKSLKEARGVAFTDIRLLLEKNVEFQTRFAGEIDALFASKGLETLQGNNSFDERKKRYLALRALVGISSADALPILRDEVESIYGPIVDRIDSVGGEQDKISQLCMSILFFLKRLLADGKKSEIVDANLRMKMSALRSELAAVIDHDGIVVNEQFSYMAKVLDLCVRVRRWMMFSLEENAKLDVPMTDIESDSDRRVLG